jgi:hypothetical protein
LRTIVKTRLFEEQARELFENGIRGADEFIEATEWALARRAELGSLTTTDNPPVWFLPIVEDVTRVSRLVVYYTFDTNCVYLLSIQVAAGSDN